MSQLQYVFVFIMGALYSLIKTEGTVLCIQKIECSILLGMDGTIVSY